MFTKSRLVALVAILVGCLGILFSYSCSTQEGFFSANEQTVLSGSDLAIDDPQIKKEIEFMREACLISDEIYKNWQTKTKEDLFYRSEKLVDEKTNTTIIEEMYVITKDGASDFQLMDRVSIDTMMKQAESETSTSARHRRYEHMFGSKGGKIMCRIFTSGAGKIPAEWRTALQSGMNYWNNLGLKVKFASVDATNTKIVGGYINMYVGTDPTFRSSTYAGGSSPTVPGYFGELLIINKNYYNNPKNPLTAEARGYIIAHELGHIIGLLHTNDWDGTNVDSSIDCAKWWKIDTASVMCPYTNPNQKWIGFSDCDKAVFKYYWGYGSQVV